MFSRQMHGLFEDQTIFLLIPFCFTYIQRSNKKQLLEVQENPG